MDWSDAFSGLEHIDEELYAEQKKYEDELQIFPPIELRFAAFDMCSFEKMQVCILGQDHIMDKDKQWVYRLVYQQI